MFEYVNSVPSFSRTVAYLELANGHDCLLQKPVTLYSFRQKFCVSVLDTGKPSRKQNTTPNSSLDFVRTKLSIYHRPYHVVALHPDPTLASQQILRD